MRCREKMQWISETHWTQNNMQGQGILKAEEIMSQSQGHAVHLGISKWLI